MTPAQTLIARASRFVLISTPPRILVCIFQIGITVYGGGVTRFEKPKIQVTWPLIYFIL